MFHVSFGLESNSPRVNAFSLSLRVSSSLLLMCPLRSRKPTPCLLIVLYPQFPTFTEIHTAGVADPHEWQIPQRN
ncbi:hypothetical protein PM082_010747 [Marasmius tenuissimus]|nr:hypothetical protein PM082_010747 [Marasmius tenuissimus]